MLKNNKNITSIFIVPTLGIPSKTLKEHGFVSGYMQDLNHDLDYTDVVYLLFRPTNITDFKFFLENQYEENKLIIEDYNQEENDVIVVYKLKEEFKEDYDLIYQGKYSHTSSEFQALFPEEVVIEGLPRESLHNLIFNKNPKLAKYWENILGSEQISDKGLELWPILNIKNEILNYDDREVEGDNQELSQNN